MDKKEIDSRVAMSKRGDRGRIVLKSALITRRNDFQFS